MIKLFKNSMVILGLAGMLFLGSCKKDEPALPSSSVTFESAQMGTSASEAQLTINVNASRAVSTNSSVNVRFETSRGIAYGTHFTTEPAAVGGLISLTIPVSTTQASIVLKRVAGASFLAEDKVTFNISAGGNGLLVGESNVLVLSFAEILATQGISEITGGGATYSNKVFIDLSGNRLTSVPRTSWDLAFSTTDDFRVVLNSPNGMLAYKLAGKTDLATVVAADTTNLGARLSLSSIFAALTGGPAPSWLPDAIKWADNPTGDLTKTAIDAVSATASENVVYIINRGDGPGTPATKLGWKKIRIIRNGSNYTLQHADIASTTFTSVNITKNPEYRFTYLSFANGVVSVEPPIKKWDIAWNGYTNTTPSGNGYDIPYYFQDVIIQNPQTQTLQVLNSTIAFDNFTEANLTGLTLVSAQLNIGSLWRSGGGPGTAPSIRTDRYYIIKDPEGNYFKLRFTALTTSGERGRPQFEFKLVKKAS